MLLDKQNTFSDLQTLAAAAGTYVSPNSIDLWGGQSTAPVDTLGNAVLSDLGRSKLVELLVQITTACTSGGSATVVFNLITGTGVDGGGAINAGVVVHQSTPAIPYASLVAGYQARLEIPPGLPATGRFLGIQFIIATATITAGAFTAALVADKQTNIAIG